MYHALRVPVGGDDMRLLMAAGGTGGHLIPAIRIAQAVQRGNQDVELMFVGSDKGFEEQVVTSYGYPYTGVSARGLSRRQIWKNVAAVWNNMQAKRQSTELVNTFHPDVAVGCGGYASYFPVRACHRRHVPYVLQEQNSYPGLATRWLSKDAVRVFIAFEDATRFLKRADNVELMGNPIDPRLAKVERSEARCAWSLKDDDRVILVTGGSSGARSINDNITRNLKSIETAQPVKLLWQTGRQDAQWDGVAPTGWDVRTFAFTDQMTEAMIASDIIIARAGALTVSEIATAGRAAILVPFPFATADHQTRNAQSMVDAGGAVMINDAQLSEISLLHEAVMLLQQESRLSAMSAGAAKLARPDAADHIAAYIITLSGRHDTGQKPD